MVERYNPINLEKTCTPVTFPHMINTAVMVRRDQERLRALMIDIEPRYDFIDTDRMVQESRRDFRDGIEASVDMGMRDYESRRSTNLNNDSPSILEKIFSDLYILKIHIPQREGIDGFLREGLGIVPKIMLNSKDGGHYATSEELFAADEEWERYNLRFKAKDGSEHLTPDAAEAADRAYFERVYGF